MLEKISGSFSRGRYFLLAMFLAIAAILGIISVSNLAHAANTLLSAHNEVITIATTDGLPPNGSTGPKAYSGDGNVVLFTSGATNLPNAGSSSYGLYTYNIATNTTARVDVSTSGVAANDTLYGTGGRSEYISETGRYVTFISKATNLIDGVTGPANYYTIFKRDMQTGVTTQLFGRSITGYPQNYDRNLAVSNGGRFVLAASRYITNTYPNAYGIIYGDSSTGTFSWSSLGNLNYQGVDDMTVGGMSCDGSFAVFQRYGEIRLVDLRRGSTIQITAGGSLSTSPLISCNGTYVLYATKNRTDISTTPSGMNTELHLVRYNRITGERQYIDSNSSGIFSSGFWYDSPYNPQTNAFSASIADTGDVVFNYNGSRYLKHLSDGSGTLESIAITATSSYLNVNNGEITQDGRYIFFKADPYDLGLASSPSGNQIIRVKTNL